MIYCKACAQKGISWFTKNEPILHKNQTDWSSAGWYPEENLPVKLPDISDYKPEGTGKGPLANHKEFYQVKCPECESLALRETDVSDTFLDSSWYFLRYPSVGYDNSPFDPKITHNWLPVNQYFGGAEHSVLHLMYSRFVTMTLNDLKFLSFDEPFPNFYAHGLVIKDGAKMSKSRGNVVNPDEYINKFGADTLRTYLMFMGPMDSYPDFRDTGIEGMHRFVKRFWSLYFEEKQIDNEKELNSILHQTIQKVTKDIEIFHYNTAISAIMELVNFLKQHGTNKESLRILSQLLAPFAPHITEELWHEVLGQSDSIHTSSWPQYDSKYIETDQSIIIIQVNGKVRSQLKVNGEEAKNENKIIELAKNDRKIETYLKDNGYKTIFVPGKIINFVTAHAKR
jgi:leucyl-tRNA synthetase